MSHPQHVTLQRVFPGAFVSLVGIVILHVWNLQNLHLEVLAVLVIWEALAVVVSRMDRSVVHFCCLLIICRNIIET